MIEHFKHRWALCIQFLKWIGISISNLRLQKLIVQGQVIIIKLRQKLMNKDIREKEEISWTIKNIKINKRKIR